MRDDYQIVKKNPEIIFFFQPKFFDIQITDYQEFEESLLEEIHYSAIITSNLSVGVISVLINPLKAHYYTETVIIDSIRRFLVKHRLKRNI